MERNSKGQFKNLELKNQTINGITLLEKTDKKRRGAILWKCKCFCGNIFIAEAYRIKNGEIKSCGCTRKVFREDNFKNARKKLENGFKEGTFLNSITGNKLYKSNKSGCRGVTIRKRKNSISYIATIGVKNKNIKLGTYKTLEEAIKARKQAEEKYYKPILEKYKK